MTGHPPRGVQGDLCRKPHWRPGAEEGRFEATVVQELDRVVVNVRVFDHSAMKSLYAQIRNGDAGNVVEIVDTRGRLRRVEM